MSSDEFVLNIKSNASEDLPFRKNKQLAKAPLPKKEEQIEETSDTANNFMFNFFSVILIAIFYALIVRIRKSYIEVKFYHSFSLGILGFLEFIFNKDQFNIHCNDSYDKGENLIEKEDKVRHMTNKEYYILTTLMGVLIFTIELLSFFILKHSITHDFYISVGYSLFVIELVLIRAHNNFNKSNDVFSLIGITITLFIFLFVNIFYYHFNIYIFIISIILGGLRFLKYYVINEMNNTFKQFSINKSLIGMNIIDCVFGIIIFALYELDYKHFNFHIAIAFMMFFATICYYVSNKFFSNYQLDNK
jgi:hypothetical protein